MTEAELVAEMTAINAQLESLKSRWQSPNIFDRMNPDARRKQLADLGARRAVIEAELAKDPRSKK